MIQNDLNIDKFIYGGDYNPEQWLDRPDILKQDLLLMKKAHINTVTLGVFSWSTLEPIKDCFNFTWLEPVRVGWQKHTPKFSVSVKIVHANYTGSGIIIATPHLLTENVFESSTKSWLKHFEIIRE